MVINMAQVQPNADGLYDSVVGDQIVNDVVNPAEAAEILEEEQEHVESQENMVDDLGTTALPDPEEISPDTDVAVDFYAVSPLSAVASNSVFTPQAWQINLATGRQLGEHYLMYAVRNTGSYNSYWHYYLVLGKDISYDADVYLYSDADVYSYYSYDSTVVYEVIPSSSGQVSGSSVLVYSDLYFDYVGIDPLSNSFAYITFAFFFIICVLIMIGGRRHV